jgi:hypothetical protein
VAGASRRGRFLRAGLQFAHPTPMSHQQKKRRKPLHASRPESTRKGAPGPIPSQECDPSQSVLWSPPPAPGPGQAPKDFSFFRRASNSWAWWKEYVWGLGHSTTSGVTPLAVLQTNATTSGKVVIRLCSTILGVKHHTFHTAGWKAYRASRVIRAQQL